AHVSARRGAIVGIREGAIGNSSSRCIRRHRPVQERFGSWGGGAPGRHAVAARKGRLPPGARSESRRFRYAALSLPALAIEMRGERPAPTKPARDLVTDEPVPGNRLVGIAADQPLVSRPLLGCRLWIILSKSEGPYMSGAPCRALAASDSHRIALEHEIQGLGR